MGSPDFPDSRAGAFGFAHGETVKYKTVKWKPVKLPLADQKHLEYAHGWLGLGNWLEANSEVENITPQFRAFPEVLRVRLAIYEKAGNWLLAYDVGNALFATATAYSMDMFNFARAACKLGKLREAFNAIQRAIDCAGDQRNKNNFRAMALNDEDFKPLWTDISEI